MAFACLLAASFPAHAVELSIPAGGTFDPFLLALKPGVQMSPLPAWMEGPASIRPEAGHVEIPISPLWKEASVEMYAVTVVFEDTGDGGPATAARMICGGSFPSFDPSGIALYIPDSR